MSEARYSSSDIPNFDTYPSETSRKVEFETVPRSELEIRAARVGAALGRLVLLLRRKQEIAQQKLSVMAEDATAALNQTADTAKARASEASEVAGNKAQEILNNVGRQADQFRERATLNLKRARVRAQEIQRDQPESVALGA